MRNWIAASMLALVAGAGFAQDAPTRDTVVASVNGTDITLGQVIIAFGQLPAQYQQLPGEILLPGLIDQLISQQLLAETLTEMPARAAIALANEERSLKAGEVVQALAEAAVTDEAIQAAYDTTYGSAEPATEYNAAHILVATAEEAAAVQARLAAGEDFAAVAAEVSTDTGSGANGGDLGWFGLGMMVPEFEAAVVGATVGQVTEPVQSQFGFHLVLVKETREATPPALDEVREEIVAGLQEAAITGRLEELRAAATITRAEDGSIDPAQLMNLDLLAD